MDNYTRLIKTRPLNAAATRAGAPAPPETEKLLFGLSRLWHTRIEDAAAFAAGVIFLVIAVWGEFTCVRTIYWQEVSKNWPTAPGTMMRVEWRDAGHAHFTRLLYRYKVYGYWHEGQTDDLPHFSYRQLKEMFQRRKAISLRYNPDDPTVSVFDPGLSFLTVFRLMGSICCIWPGWYFVVPFLRGLRILSRTYHRPDFPLM